MSDAEFYATTPEEEGALDQEKETRANTEELKPVLMKDRPPIYGQRLVFWTRHGEFTGFYVKRLHPHDCSTAFVSKSVYYHEREVIAWYPIPMF